MPNDSLAANAVAMPMNRRAALGSLAAASGLLAFPGAAQAAPDDAHICAAIGSLKALQRIKETAADSLAACEERLPRRSQFPALLARQDDRAIFGTEKPVGEPLDSYDIEAAHNAQRALQMCGIVGASALFGPALIRLGEIEQANTEFRRLWRAAKDHPDYLAFEGAFAEAASAVFDAETEMLKLRPETVAGLGALAAALLDANFFDSAAGGEALAQMLIEAPALHQGA